MHAAAAISLSLTLPDTITNAQPMNMAANIAAAFKTLRQSRFQSIFYCLDRSQAS
jgi:hypothetical protein